MTTLKKLVEHVPPELEPEVKDFVEFVLSKHRKEKTGRMHLHWRGVLKELGEDYTSVELQHKSLQWWGD